MKVIHLDLRGALILEPKIIRDDRGYFSESFNQNALSNIGVNCLFIQENHSLSSAGGTLRGMHYQLEPKAQTKLVRVIRGAIYDVILDIREKSPTFGKWTGVILSEFNHRQLLVPKGFAHGFCTITLNVEISYKVDEYYSPEHERGIVWNDPSLRINWPFSNVILSEKDRTHPLMKEAEINFNYTDITS